MVFTFTLRIMLVWYVMSLLKLGGLRGGNDERDEDEVLHQQGQHKVVEDMRGIGDEA